MLFAAAALLLASSPHPGAPFLEAREHARAGRTAEALAALAGLEARVPAIADRVLHLRAEVLADAGRTAEAIEAYRAVPDGSLLAPRARIARARLAAPADRAAALEALAPLLASDAPVDLSRPDHAATALLLAGRLMAEGGDAAGARRAFAGCWTGHPLSPESAECGAAVPSFDRAELLRRAEALLDANRNAAALSILRPLQAGGAAGAGPMSPFACRVAAAAGRAHRKERSYGVAVEALRPVVARCEDADVRVRSLYLLASAASIGGDAGEAEAAYLRLAREFPAHSFADDALFFAADLRLRAGKPEEARALLDRLAREHPRGDYRDEARFRAAWLARQAGEEADAVARLELIERERRGDAYEHARAAYWRARWIAGRGEEGSARARALWAELAARYPADYYGLLSRARLGAEGAREAPPAPAGAPAGPPGAWEAGPLRGDPRLSAGTVLLEMGLLPEAAEELGAIDPGLLREASATAPGAVLHVADLLDRAGDHRAAHNLLRTRAREVLRRPPEGENRRAWEIAYPGAFREEVERWAADAGVPPDLVHALMREESGLDPLAVSRAGAVGLTQLMPSTASHVARKIGLGQVGRADLSRPDLNIRLGAKHLGDLLRRFEGSLALALAAYNAGGGAVSRWIGRRGGLDLDEFVEEIPVEETRGYVKRVLRSFAAYRLLQDSPEEGWERGLLGKAGGA